MNLRDFWSELRRRRVVRVTAVYLAVAWLAMQVASVVFPALELPPWTLRLVVIAAIIGLPVVIVLSWVFDVTPDGLERTASRTQHEPLRSNVQWRVAAVLAAIILLSVSWFAVPRLFDDDLDRGLVAVLPFRVSGTDAALEPLGEGMVDLVSMKLQDGAGVRAVDARAVIAAWRRAGGERADLLESDMLALSRRLGAARMLTGEVVSAGGNVVLRAALIDVARGQRVSAHIEGHADSLTWHVERLMRALLARDAGEREDRLALLATASLPALMEYVRGQAQYRRGNYSAARDAFLAAIDHDSTFALAAMGVHLVASWSGGAPTPAQLTRARRIAWDARLRLSPVDRAMLHALVGSRYPAIPTEAESCRAWDGALALAPDRTELLHWVADCAFHHGRVLAMPDPLTRAREFFRRSLAADSMFVPSIDHLLQIAAAQGDTAEVRRLGRLYFATADTSFQRRATVRWLTAWSRDDTTTLKRMARDFGDTWQAAPALIAKFLRESNLGVEWATAIHDALPRPTENSVLSGYLFEKMFVALLEGRHDAAIAAATAADSMSGNMNAARLLVYAGIYSELDSLRTAQLVQQLAARMPANVPAQPSERGPYYNNACAVTQWRLWQRDTTGARAAIAALDAVPDTAPLSASAIAAARVCARILHGAYAYATASPELRMQAFRLDSLAVEYPRNTVQSQLLRFVAARLLEAAGEPEAALRAVQRATYMLGTEAFQEARHRETARLAERVGDRTRARLEYEKYIAFRAREDSTGRAASQRVRAALARLTQEVSTNR